MTLHKEGHSYVLIGFLIYGLLLLLSYWAFNPHLMWMIPVGVVAGLLQFWVIWFFRMPSRVHTEGADLVISPCDGKVVVIEKVYEPEYFKSERLQVSVFMSPLNVHVNRYPISGVVRYVKYHAGKYLVAWHPKSSTENERSTVVLQGEHGEVLVRQIAGALARRIVTYSREGEQVNQNQELGFIKFGSRVDLFLPLDCRVDVKIGDVVQNGVSRIAHFSSAS
jgi:phosphatidylserine decarboxylase